ncbi:hypothetical protein ASPZODRAFT_131936 [Penicilliopsis zonata CBS 506.65]|uniref:Pinin/SDK/MemA protein domain-containing protein n=1 Tax=Penicilliopsis zonata CBS 506.65 TaxID=1073090 RepID=A0A1L9SIF8_9EURO|nr:hypothetical protein ASPZODRAFT_131936 [Penicilliopsis zonata CBS 506.65]OJJ47012.1 hypothetical protein ASPZODRAFT_131936 [Penicilliopsis zonata CBS 506.65]
MADGSLASAVALPEPDDRPQSPEESRLKRRNSSVADPDYKRRRLSSPGERRRASPDAELKEGRQESDRQTDRRAGRRAGREEERRRGQRLFGALLGTLSQTSTVAAQKRRADIEKRQRDKLRLQEEEYDELKKKKKAELLGARQKEHRIYERESMRVRHSNMLAMAHCLKTKTKPVLYYKPWQLQREEEEIIQEQIDEAEATIARETAEFEARHPPEEEAQSKESVPPEKERADVTQTEANQPADAVPETSNAPEPEPNDANQSEATHSDTVASIHDPNLADHNTEDAHRDGEDDGGEMVEDNEDTVMY